MLQDLAIAQLFREKYGTRCSTGPGFIDAPVPGPLSIYERTLKSFCASLAGEPLFNAGILGAGLVFSPEQLMIDLDIAYAQNAFCQGIGGNHFEDSLYLIREKGIGGFFFDTDHTARNYRECIWIPKIFDRLKGTDVQNALKSDPVEIAYNRWREIIDKTDLYSIDDDRRREIDRIVQKASKVLSSIEGATD